MDFSAEGSDSGGGSSSGWGALGQALGTFAGQAWQGYQADQARQDVMQAQAAQRAQALQLAQIKAGTTTVGYNAMSVGLIGLGLVMFIVMMSR